MNIEQKLKNLITKTLEELGIETPEVYLEHPAEISHGDYSTNVALVYGKKLGKNPSEFAEEIVVALRQAQGDLNFVHKIEIAGPGFINFYLSKKFFVEITSEILNKEENWGKNESLKNQKVIIEYTQPNPFKEFHIGHLVNNIEGEAISRVIEAQGAEVKRATYHGDVGLHVAKTIWSLSKSKAGNGDLTVEILGKAYAEGDKVYAEDETAKKEITEINKKIYEKSDSEINKLYEKGREISFKKFEEIYKRLGSYFDTRFLESEAGPVGLKLVKEFLGDVFEESERAVIFPEEKSKLHTRVFINSEGLPTYEAKDLGLVKLKKDFYDFDRSITITDIEQAEYYKVVMKAIEFVYPDLSGKIEHISHGRLRLAEGRMSSRTGNIISGESLLNDLKNLALSKMEEREISNKEEIADEIAVSALKYSILKQSPGKNIVFDFEKSLSFEGDSGPYLQYSSVRAKSVLEKAKEENIQGLALESKAKPWMEGGIFEIERLLYRFPEIIERAGKEKDYAPHYVATYLIDLAGAFNSFYGKEKIVDKEDKNSPYKIALTEAVLTTLKNGLWILGIEVPEKM